MSRSVSLVRFALRALGLYERGRRNALAIQVSEVEVPVHGLPAAFDGLRIIHLSDLHFSGRENPRAETLKRILPELRADVAVVTGDVVSHVWRHDRTAIAAACDVAPALDCPLGMYAVPGNHDSHEAMRALASHGVQVLEDRSVRIERDAQVITLAGMKSLLHAEGAERRRSLASLPMEGFTVVLAHEPDWARQVARKGVGLYLCGHTHGGQIAVPVIGAPALWMAAWRRRGVGLWRSGHMAGYTSRGIGTSYMPVRFGCPPEVAVLTLRPAATAARAS